VLIGDAAGYLDAITGEGISLALAQALALEEKVVPDLVKGKTVKTTSLDAFAKAYRAIMAPYYRMTRLVLYLSGHPILANSTIALLSRSPNLFANLLSANMGFPGEGLQ
jgi:flavin-dependent dehydrogenase